MTNTEKLIEEVDVLNNEAAYLEVRELLTPEILLEHNDADLYRAVGIALDKTREYKQAIAAYTTALVLRPGDSDLLLLRAEAFSNHGEFDKAFADINESMEILEPYSGHYITLGNVWLDKKEYVKAHENYDKAIELAPEDKSG